MNIVKKKQEFRPNRTLEGEPPKRMNKLIYAPVPVMTQARSTQKNPEYHGRPVIPLRGIVDEMPADPVLNRQRDVMINTLTVNEWKFVQEYMVDYDEGRAYHLIYNCIPSRAYISGKRLLRRPKIQAAVSEYLRQYGEKLQISKEAIIARVWEEALNMGAKSSERLTALKLMAELTGVVAAAEKGGKKAPVIKVTINDNSGSTQVNFESSSEEGEDGDKEDRIIDVTPEVNVVITEPDINE